MFKSTHGRLRDIMSTNDNEEIDMNSRFYLIISRSPLQTCYIVKR